MTPTPQEPAPTKEKILTSSIQDGERIVISGMSGLYPQSRSVKDLSELLYNKVNPVSEKGLRFKCNHPEVVQHTGTVPDVNLFDAQFFKVYNRLSNSMDPMSRKMLEQSYQAIYDAGINPEQLSGKKIGVYAGTCFSETEKGMFYEAASQIGLGITGLSKTMFANRISYWLNAKGPSMSIDQACSSSTAALEQAYLAISRGECEAAIVTGAYLCLHPQPYIHYGRLMKICADGKTKSFDQNADGWAKSEAITVMFLQKAKDALRIYAELLHVKTEFTQLLPGETGPMYGFCRDVTTTSNFIKKFYEEAKISTHAVEYVEAFGCAVPEADKAELQAIEEVYCNEKDDSLLVGSVMSNIGYNEAASGLSAITKVLLGYHTGQLAANLHCSNPRQDVAALRDGRMRIVTEHQPFRRTYAAVNGMSVTGVNSHVLLHGNHKPKNLKRYKSNIPYLVTISGRHEETVEYIFKCLKSEPIDPEQIRLLHNIHQAGIAGHLGRGYIILKTNEVNETVSLSERAEYFDKARRPLWFVYSGMGSQWAGMGTQLMRIPIFAAAIQRCRKILEPKGIDIVHIITSPDEKIFDNILHSFVGIAAIQIGLTDVLRELGLVPDGIIGHSVGELGCAYADGCLTAEEMILAAFSRGQVSLETSFIRGSMAAVGLGFSQISKICPSEIEVACHNGPESSTISGPADVMREFVAELTAKEIFAKEVPCSNIAYHSHYIAEAGPQLLAYLSDVIKTPKPRSQRWLSTSVPQEKWNDPEAKLCSAEYHTNNLLSPVLFEETSRLIPSNAVLVEVAPHGLLQAILKRSLPSSCTNIALTRRKHPDNTFLFLEAIGKLFIEGYHTKIHILYPKIELPVSTGTPFLSNLVQWAHGEKWLMRLYSTADRITSATCNYVLSIHDTEHSYLQGHHIRGNTLYPFAATLVLVWDTFAMIFGLPKKHVSVQFNDLHLYAQPVLHDQRQLRINLSIHRGNGRFEVRNEGSKVMTGYIYHSNAKNTNEKVKINQETGKLLKMDITAEDIYHLLRDRDYSYSDKFRSLQCVNKSMDKARVTWCNNWVTLIDGLLQLNVLRQSHDGVSMPTYIRNISINLKKHDFLLNNLEDKTVPYFTAEIVDNTETTRCGGISIHNVRFENWPHMNDIKMILKTKKTVSYFQSDTNDNWEDEYCIPAQENASKSINMTLQTNQIGDYDSLTWVEVPDMNGPGVPVTVHYAGINIDDIKKADGSLLYNQNSKHFIGMDFSGITDSGERVMGLVRGGAASAIVRGQPHLLWPVPAHWSLEDAATVPLAYVYALYCLVIKSDFRPGLCILVHGGAGALGQAVIAIALTHDCEVFTTVSDMHKKRFLLKLFPKLKADHIGNSRDATFGDMVLLATNGKGCNIVIGSVEGILKDISIQCLGSNGQYLDVRQLHDHENYNFGMSHLWKSRNYIITNLLTIFEEEYIEEATVIQQMLADGIRRGYVRPLSRVTYAPHDTARAFRLLAASRHRGRVLLRMREQISRPQPTLKCSAQKCHLIITDDGIFGVQFADRLVLRGAMKLCIHIKEQSMSYLQIKIRSWQRSGVEVVVFIEDLNREMDVTTLLNNCTLCLGPLEGIYVTLGSNQAEPQETVLTTLDLVSRNLCPDMKYFAILNIGSSNIGQDVCLRRLQNQLPATFLAIPELSDGLKSNGAYIRGAVDAAERALRVAHGVLLARSEHAHSTSLLDKIATLAGVAIPENSKKTFTLKDLGVKSDKLQTICNLLRVHYNIAFEEEQVSLLTIEMIQEMDTTITGTDFEDVKGLSKFINYIDPDELQATMEMIFLPTLTDSAAMRDDEFPACRAYLCIVPGIEGHHERFRLLCERLKLPALVLQPGLDRPHETVGETAERFTKVLMAKTGMENTFYLLGYESGIFVALEMAAIFEDHGMTGIVYCLGLAPDEFQDLLKRQAEFETEERLQDAVVLHMFTLMAGADSTALESALRVARTWTEKVDACVSRLRGRVAHSAQYTRAVLEAALARLSLARSHAPRAHALRSQLVLLRAATQHACRAHALQTHSLRPVAEHQLQQPPAHAARDLRCAAIINTYLDPVLLEEFHEKNICDTYLLNEDSFFSIEFEDKKIE